MSKKYWWKNEGTKVYKDKSKYTDGTYRFCYNAEGQYDFYIKEIAVCYGNWSQDEREERYGNAKFIWGGCYGGVGYSDNILKAETIDEAKAEFEEIYYKMLSNRVKALNEAKREAIEEEEDFFLYLEKKKQKEVSKDVKHGYWKRDGGFNQCSVCGRVVLQPHITQPNTSETFHRECPFCNSIMDLKESDDETKEVDIQLIIKEIDKLFVNYGRDIHVFTVDFNEDTDCLYGYYTPHINDSGYVVFNDFLNVSETSKKTLQTLKDYLDKNKIRSRLGCEWEVDWGYNEE